MASTNLREKIELRMQILETMMKKQMHIQDPQTVDLFLEQKFFKSLTISEN